MIGEGLAGVIKKLGGIPEVMDAVAEDILAEAQETFRTHVDPFGVRWPEQSPVTVKMAKRPHGLMEDTGALKAMSKRVEPLAAYVGHTPPYSAAVVLGNPRNRLPTRIKNSRPPRYSRKPPKGNAAPIPQRLTLPIRNGKFSPPDDQRKGIVTMITRGLGLREKGGA